jgi:hypothetical protein
MELRNLARIEFITTDALLELVREIKVSASVSQKIEGHQADNT